MLQLEIINLNEIYGKEFIEKWKEKYPIFQTDEVEKWIRHKCEQYSREGKDPKKFVVTAYLKPLQDYCDHYNVADPKELLKEDIDTRNRRLIRYLSELLRNGAAESSVKNMIQSRIKSFYSDRGSPISDGLKTVKSGRNENEIILNKDLIKKIQAKLQRPEYRLILKFQALTGLRISDVLDELTSGRYKIEKYKDHYFIRNFVTRKETVAINYIFFPDELSILIKSAYNSDLEKLDLKKILMTRNKTRIKRYDFNDRIKDIAEELEIEKNIKTHSFRKYFSTQVRKCNELDKEFQEHLLGHMLTNLAGSYNQNLQDIEWFYQNWLKIENLICIDCIIMDKTADEIIELRKEISKRDEIIDKLVKQNTDIEKRLDKFEEIFILDEKGLPRFKFDWERLIKEMEKHKK